MNQKILKNRRRIDTKSSRTAGFNCMYRAASYLEKHELYQSGDYIAPRLLPGLIKFLVKYRLVNFNWKFFPRGIYEYVIARTKYIDKIFKDSLEDGIDQILIFGAGFDSRAVRFAEDNINTTIFELDSPHTQNAKISQFKKRHVPVPDNAIFIPVDFNVDSASEKLELNGFRRDKTTLFIMEGLVMYLYEEAVDELFNLIYRLAVSGSSLVFDYIYASVLRQENVYYGERDIYRKVNSVQESWLFGIEEGEIEAFLGNYNFTLIQNLAAEDLEKMFFKDEFDNIVGKVNGTHCLAYVKK